MRPVSTGYPRRPEAVVSAYTRAVLDWIWLPAVVVVYFALTRWLLPRLGVKS